MNVSGNNKCLGPTTHETHDSEPPYPVFRTVSYISCGAPGGRTQAFEPGRHRTSSPALDGGALLAARGTHPSPRAFWPRQNYRVPVFREKRAQDLSSDKMSCIGTTCKVREIISPDESSSPECIWYVMEYAVCTVVNM